MTDRREVWVSVWLSVFITRVGNKLCIPIWINNRSSRTWKILAQFQTVRPG